MACSRLRAWNSCSRASAAWSVASTYEFIVASYSACCARICAFSCSCSERSLFTRAARIFSASLRAARWHVVVGQQ